MASGIKCSVKFGRFKWNKAGYVKVMNSAGVQAMLERKAESMAAACNADFEPHGDGDRSGYDVRPRQGKLAKGYKVRAYGAHGLASEQKHNRLLRQIR